MAFLMHAFSFANATKNHSRWIEVKLLSLNYMLKCHHVSASIAGQWQLMWHWNENEIGCQSPCVIKVSGNDHTDGKNVFLERVSDPWSVQSPYDLYGMDVL